MSVNQDPLAGLEQWYEHHCNGLWEHDYRITLETLDNPGWMLKVNLVGTLLESKSHSGISFGVLGNMTADEWMHCKVENRVFVAAGNKVRPLIEEFLRWAEGSY